MQDTEGDFVLVPHRKELVRQKELEAFFPPPIAAITLAYLHRPSLKDLDPKAQKNWVQRIFPLAQKLWCEELRDKSLDGARSKALRLQRAELLTNYRLEQAVLMDDDLSNFYLAERDLSKASLMRSLLIGTDLHGANLRDANLEYALLTDADLTCAHLQGVHFWGASLKGAKLEGAHLNIYSALSLLSVPCPVEISKFLREAIPFYLEKALKAPGVVSMPFFSPESPAMKLFQTLRAQPSRERLQDFLLRQEISEVCAHTSFIISPRQLALDKQNKYVPVEDPGQSRCVVS